MTVVVTGNCRLCRFTECVDMCPVTCFHADAEMLYVDPEECIDCLACIVVCPVHAILREQDVPEDLRDWIGINRVRASSLPVIVRKESPLPTAERRRVELGFPRRGVE